MLPLTPHSYIYIFILAGEYNRGNTNRTCIGEFEVRYSTFELYPLALIGLRGDRTLNQQICNPCVVPYYRLSPLYIYIYI